MLRVILALAVVLILVLELVIVAVLVLVVTLTLMVVIGLTIVLALGAALLDVKPELTLELATTAEEAEIVAAPPAVDDANEAVSKASVTEI